MSISDWEQRFRTPVSYLPEWSPLAPGHAVYTSNESGSWQVHALDVDRDTTRQVTNDPVGLTDAVPTLDGEGVLWFEDATGDESGRWLVQPFDGGDARPFLDGVPHGWSEGLAQAPGLVVAGIADRRGFAVHVTSNGGPARELLRSSEWIGLGSGEDGGLLRGALSADGTLLCLEHAEHGDLVHPALRVVDPHTGDTVGELLDEGMSLAAKCWSPVAGDGRLAFRHELEGDERPGIWNPTTGERTNLAIDLQGAVSVADWWPDGSALLLVNLFEGRSRLYRYELESASLARIESEPGFVWKARVRPDGHIWFLHEQGRRRRLVLDDAGAEVVSFGVAATRLSPLRVVALRQRARPAGARLRRHPGRLGRPVPGDDVRPRRPDMARHRSLAARGAGLRRPGVRDRTRELPWLDRIRPRVARHAHREHRRPRARGRERGAAGSRGTGACRPRARGRRRVLLGRLRHAARGRQAPGALDVRHRGRARRRLRGRVRGAVAEPPGLRPRAPRREDPGGAAGADARPECDQLRRRRPGPGPVLHRTQRLTLPRTARRWRTSTSWRRASIPTRWSSTRPGTRRSTWTRRWPTSASLATSSAVTFPDCARQPVSQRLRGAPCPRGARATRLPRSRPRTRGRPARARRSHAPNRRLRRP